MRPYHVLTIVQGTFLFTSESVGEGHPDKIWYVESPHAPPLPSPAARMPKLCALSPMRRVFVSERKIIPRLPTMALFR